MLRVITDSSLYCRQLWPLEYRHGVHILCFSIGLCLDQSRDTEGIVVFCLLFGFFSGAFVSLGPAVVSALTPDPRLFAARLGTEKG